MMKFSYRIDDMEVRSCNDYLLSEEPHTRAEIVRHISDGSCYAVARWVEDTEGFDLHFVGKRPFSVEPVSFMKLAELGQYMLDKHLEWKHL